MLSSDKPGPIQHLRVSDVRSDSAYLSWKDPEDNGGSRITNFVVEKKDTASTQWVPVCSTSKKRSMMLKHLMEGTSYSFRVAAENQYGRSEYVETPKAIKAMNPLCKYQHSESIFRKHTSCLVCSLLYCPSILCFSPSWSS